MNKKIFLTILLLLSTVLTACASTNTRGFGNSSMRNSPAMELPAQTKLLLGMLKLEGTDNAITADQAKELLPMVYVLKDLNESDTAAEAEKDGLTNQIQEKLTSEQVTAINALNLSFRDVLALTQGGNSATGSKQTSSIAGGNGGGGAGMGGPPPDMGGGGGGFPGGGGPSGGSGGTSSGTTSRNTTSSNSQAANTQIMKTPSALFDSVIKMLQGKNKQ